MIVAYDAGKYVNTNAIETIDTTVSPPTFVAGGITYTIAAGYGAGIRRALLLDPTVPPPPPPGAPAPTSGTAPH